MREPEECVWQSQCQRSKTVWIITWYHSPPQQISYWELVWLILFQWLFKQKLCKIREACVQHQKMLSIVEYIFGMPSLCWIPWYLLLHFYTFLPTNKVNQDLSCLVECHEYLCFIIHTHPQSIWPHSWFHLWKMWKPSLLHTLAYGLTKVLVKIISKHFFGY